MAVLGVRHCASVSLVMESGGCSLIAVLELLIVVTSLVAEHRLGSCDPQAYLPCGMWDPPRPRIELMSPALAGGFLTTEPPGKP